MDTWGCTGTALRASRRDRRNVRVKVRVRHARSGARRDELLDLSERDGAHVLPAALRVVPRDDHLERLLEIPSRRPSEPRFRGRGIERQVAPLRWMRGVVELPAQLAAP